MDSKGGWLVGGDSGEAAILPGNPQDSLIIQAVRYQDGLEMPPSGRLPETLISDLVFWVESGAFDPRTDPQVEIKRADKSWWSLQPLQQFDQPNRNSSQAIDNFLLSKLKENGLGFNPPADPRSLIRRMTYDVIGLPPTAQQVEDFAKAFLRDGPAATEDLVDRLLASPHYGEQWGRHWLDVIRFGESIGFERNVIIDDLWPFRDYVIASINAGKPFNQFIQEHLAGDVLAPDQPEVAVGSAFLVAGPYDDVGNQDVVAQANIRAATLDEIITATSGAFLGLTVNCARCHHHKFDPIPTEDYYRLRAAFEGVKHGRRVLATKQQRDEHASAVAPLNRRKSQLTSQLSNLEQDIVQRATSLLQQRKFARPKIDPQFTEETFQPVTAKFVRVVFHASTDQPQTAVGSRLVEFEVWTSGKDSKNVALTSQGAVAEGARSAVAEDFPQAYGPQFTIDGKFGEQWFIGNPSQLTITLATAQIVDRITFSNAKGVDIQDKAQGATPCEYEILVSLDGEEWQTVADSFDRQPWSAKHGIQRLRREVISAQESQEIGELEKQLREIEQQLASIEPLHQVWVGTHQQPTGPTRLHIGGDPMKLGPEVVPASLAVLTDATQSYALPLDATESERRLKLAQWITADENPLTARVLANRIWQYHFGTGIVDTPSDFGFLGGQPSHAELLDWLAQRLLAHDWRLKPLHREILLTQAYRQSSGYREEAAAVDRDSRLLWRFPPRRLSAEEIRDTMLYVSGKLSGTMDQDSLTPTSSEQRLAGGPGFRLYKFTQNNVCTYFPLDKHGPETYRRAVYHQNARASVVDLLTDFDLPDIAFAAPVRANTTTPLQALTLLNHSFTLDMAHALVARAEHSTGAEQPKELVHEVYRLALQRAPLAEEREASVDFIREHGAVAFCRAVLNLNEVLYVE